MTVADNVAAFAARVAEEFNARPGPAPLRTLTLPYSNGGPGGSVSNDIAAATAGSFRFVVKLPVTADRWRIRLRNRNLAWDSRPNATLKSLIVGLHDRSPSGAATETGSFVGNTATTIVGTDQTIPGDGSWYTSPWVETEGDVFEKNVEFLIGIGYTFASSHAVKTSCGRAWHWTNSTSATNPAIAGSGATDRFIPFDWVIEYEATTRNRITLVIGDSISEGITGGVSALAPTSLHLAPFNQWAARTNRCIVNLSIAGIALQGVAASTASSAFIWERQADLSTIPFDEVIISGGSNDIFPNGRSLANVQSDIDTIRGRLAGYGINAPIYAATILARNASNATWTSYNDWLAQRPSFTTDVIDFYGALRGASATTIMPQYTSDNIHPSRLGCLAMADKLAAILP